ncbi:hypothetical protein SDA20_03300 [Legionella pneumophila serogroup 1]|nr:hypothetical protein [Legionella pneumophila]HDO9973309.1 hypothetical protein [Legionella pneumophila]
MDASSFGFILKTFNWLLSRAGYKIVSADEYLKEDIPVQVNFVDSDPVIQKEKQAGSIFRWSNLRHPGFVYYEVIKGHVKERYKSGNHYLWVKRPNQN